MHPHHPPRPHRQPQPHHRPSGSPHQRPPGHHRPPPPPRRPLPPRRSPPPPRGGYGGNPFLSGTTHSAMRSHAMHGDWRITVGILLIGLMSTIATTLGGINMMILLVLTLIMAYVGGGLYYKYNKDRAEAAETERLLSTDLNDIAENDELLVRYSNNDN